MNYIKIKNQKAKTFLEEKGFTLKRGYKRVEIGYDLIDPTVVYDEVYIVIDFPGGTNKFHKYLKDNGLLYKDQLNSAKK